MNPTPSSTATTTNSRSDDTANNNNNNNNTLGTSTTTTGRETAASTTSIAATMIEQQQQQTPPLLQQNAAVVGGGYATTRDSLSNSNNMSDKNDDAAVVAVARRGDEASSAALQQQQQAVEYRVQWNTSNDPNNNSMMNDAMNPTSTSTQQPPPAQYDKPDISPPNAAYSPQNIRKLQSTIASTTFPSVPFLRQRNNPTTNNDDNDVRIVPRPAVGTLASSLPLSSQQQQLLDIHSVAQELQELEEEYYYSYHSSSQHSQASSTIPPFDDGSTSKAGSSSYHFMSEPSVSEDGDSFHSRVRAPHRYIHDPVPPPPPSDDTSYPPPRQPSRQQRAYSITSTEEYGMTTPIVGSPASSSAAQQQRHYPDHFGDNTMGGRNRTTRTKSNTSSGSGYQTPDDSSSPHRTSSFGSKRQEDVEGGNDGGGDRPHPPQQQSSSWYQQPQQQRRQVAGLRRSHPQQATQQNRSGTVSPGNTSISSWEQSPASFHHPKKQVLLQFVMPESKYQQQKQRNNNNSSNHNNNNVDYIQDYNAYLQQQHYPTTTTTTTSRRRKSADHSSNSNSNNHQVMTLPFVMDHPSSQQQPHRRHHHHHRPSYSDGGRELLVQQPSPRPYRSNSYTSSNSNNSTNHDNNSSTMSSHYPYGSMEDEARHRPFAAGSTSTSAVVVPASNSSTSSSPTKTNNIPVLSSVLLRPRRSGGGRNDNNNNNNGGRTFWKNLRSLSDFVSLGSSSTTSSVAVASTLAAAQQTEEPAINNNNKNMNRSTSKHRRRAGAAGNSSIVSETTDPAERTTTTSTTMHPGLEYLHASRTKSPPPLHHDITTRGMSKNGIRVHDDDPETKALLLSPTQSINPNSVDDSLAMTLSDSEPGGGGSYFAASGGTGEDDDDGISGNDDSAHSSDRPLDWEVHNSADDEKTATSTTEPRGSTSHLLPRVRRNKINHIPSHRRNRSGDETAAKLATGGREWKGMDQNAVQQLQGSAVAEEDDDDDDTSNNDAVVVSRKPQRFNRQNIASAARQLGPPVAATAAATTVAQTVLGPAGEAPPQPSSGDSQLDWIKQMSMLHQMSTMDQSQNSGPCSIMQDASRERRQSYEMAHVDEDDDSDDDEDVHDDDESSTGSSGTSDVEPDGQASSRMPFSYAERLQQRHEAEKVPIPPPTPFSQTSQSPFANFGKKTAEPAPRSSFLPAPVYEPDDTKYPTFICPRCKTRQREFFTVANAAGRLEGPGSYLALYFAIYVVCSLFIFGLEEGWMPLDCTYFAVITLTTAGLGDFVPTSDANKIICSIFIYFGVACIGLLLGSYIAGMLDDKASRDRKEKQIDACPNCARIRMAKECSGRHSRQEMEANFSSVNHRKHMSERMSGETPSHPAVLASHHGHHHHGHHEFHNPSLPFGHSDHHPHMSTTSHGVGNTTGTDDFMIGYQSPPSPVMNSPMQFLGRQRHTRHASLVFSPKQSLLADSNKPKSYGTSPTRHFHAGDQQTKPSGKLRTIASSDNLMDGFSESDDEDVSSSVVTSSTESSTEEVWDQRKSQIQAGKYVFLTLRLALVNSMVIIAVGCIGFWLIEGFSLVDSWYFTTVLLTTVGYGDIVPVTDGGKLFATVYILVAGTILLNNMSSISMIPLELRRRRIERTILTQFGDHLDDAALRELATGPVVQRLRLSANRRDGLNECTREMFSLAMLVRLGKVTEHDIRETFASFRHLDVNNEGVLNSKSIIAGMIAKQRNSRLSQMAAAAPLVAAVQEEQNMTGYWFGREGSLHVATPESTYYFHEPYQHVYDGERSTLLGMESAVLPDDEGVSWLP